jgi:predicted MFS family arabinose efflux permease
MDTSRVKGSATAAILFFVAFIGYINNLLVVPLLKGMSENLGVGAHQLGYLVTVYGLVVGLVSVVAGPISDKYGRKRLILLFTLLTVITSVLFARSQSLVQLYVFRTLNALTAGPLLALALASVGDCFPMELRGKATGVVTSALFFSSIVGIPLALVLSKVPGLEWRAAFLLVGALSGVVFLAALLLPNRHQPTGQPLRFRPVLERYVGFFSQGNTLPLLLFFLCAYLAVGTFVTYYPAYLMTRRELTTDGLTLVYCTGGFFAFWATRLAGHLADRFNTLVMALLASAIIIITKLVVLNVPTTAETVTAIIVVITIFYMSSDAFRLTSMQTEAVKSVPAESRGAFFGLVSFLMAVGNSLGAAFGSLVLANGHRFSEQPERFAGYVVSCGVAIALILTSMGVLAVRLYRTGQRVHGSPGF